METLLRPSNLLPVWVRKLISFTLTFGFFCIVNCFCMVDGVSVKYSDIIFILT